MRLTTRVRHEPGPSFAARSALTAAWTSAAIVVVLLLIFRLDGATGSAPVQHLYYIPIILAALRFGYAGGVAVPVAAIVLYHLANPQLVSFRYEHWDLVQMALFAAVGVMTAKLTGDARRLHALAMTDDLTGLHNLRSFEQRLSGMVHASRDEGTSLALLVLDLDRLKALNDQHGHLAGAEAVRTVGHVIASRAPDGAVSCRYGGDEFVVALPDCTPERAREFAEELRQAVAATAPVLAGTAFPAATLSISIGVVSRFVGSNGIPDAIAGEALFGAADAALYEAKERGRNQIHMV